MARLCPLVGAGLLLSGAVEWMEFTDTSDILLVEKNDPN
jgi:hypothetical protein